MSWREKFAEVPASERFRKSSRPNGQDTSPDEPLDEFPTDTALQKNQQTTLSPSKPTITSISMQISPIKKFERPSFAKKLIELDNMVRRTVREVVKNTQTSVSVTPNLSSQQTVTKQKKKRSLQQTSPLFDANKSSTSVKEPKSKTTSFFDKFASSPDLLTFCSDDHFATFSQDGQPDDSDISMASRSPDPLPPNNSVNPLKTPEHLIIKPKRVLSNISNITHMDSTPIEYSPEVDKHSSQSISDLDKVSPSQTSDIKDDLVPIATPRSKVDEILMVTTSLNHADDFDFLNLVLKTDAFKHISGAHFDFADLSRGFDLGYKWGELLLIFCQNMAEMHNRCNFSSGWEVTTSRDTE